MFFRDFGGSDSFRPRCQVFAVAVRWMGVLLFRSDLSLGIRREIFASPETGDSVVAAKSSLPSQSGQEMRSEVIKLGELGPLPSYKTVLADPEAEALVSKYEDLITAIEPPVTDAEARVLVGLFGPDECFEIEWRLIHLIETATNWPLSDCLMDSGNEWIGMLKQRVENTKRRRK